MGLFFYQRVLGASNGTLKAESAGNDRPPHMDIEAKPAFASRNIEIETAIAELDVQPWFGEVVNRAEHLPIDMRADPETAEIAIRSQPEAVTEVPVIARGDQRIGPASGAGDGYALEEPWVEAQVRREPPGTKSKAGIGVLHRVLEHAVESDPRAGIRRQLGGSALKKDVMGGDAGAHRQVEVAGEKPELPVANFCRTHERSPVEVSEEIDETDVGIHFGHERQWCLCSCVDACHPQIGRDKELVPARSGHVLRYSRTLFHTNRSQDYDKARQCPAGPSVRPDNRRNARGH